MEGQEKGLARTPSRGTEDSSATVAGAEDVVGLQRIVSRARSGSPLPDESVEKKERLSDDDWEDDPANPRNWSSGKKWTAVGIVSFYTFIPPLTSSMMAPGMQEIALKYGITNSTVLALTLSIFLLALASAFAPATGSFIGLRFLSGLAGSAPIAIGGGSISDLFSDRDRGGAMGAFSMGPLIGPVVGPIAGGFIAQTVGVKWVFIVIACLNGVAAAVGIPLLRETYHPIIRKRIAKRNGDLERLRVDPVVEEAGMSKIGIIWVNIQRPIMLLFGDVICFLLSLYMAFVYGIFYLMFATFSAFFSKTYGFKAGVGGLVYIGIGIGSLVAVIIGAKVGDRIYWGLSAKYNNGVGKPEYRVPSLILGSMVIPIGLFWYGWSAEAATDRSYPWHCCLRFRSNDDLPTHPTIPCRHLHIRSQRGRRCHLLPLHVRLRIPSVRTRDVRHARDGRRPVFACGFEYRARHTLSHLPVVQGRVYSGEESIREGECEGV
ncbi:major facilitator superfamily domain-containing protein, partial [Schizophyllum commune]